MRADAQQRRSNIIATAADLFRQRGEQVTLEEIAQQAGVGIATLYRNFPDRTALVHACAQHLAEDFLAFQRKLNDEAEVQAAPTSTDTARNTTATETGDTLDITATADSTPETAATNALDTNAAAPTDSIVTTNTAVPEEHNLPRRYAQRLLSIGLETLIPAFVPTNLDDLPPALLQLRGELIAEGSRFIHICQERGQIGPGVTHLEFVVGVLALTRSRGVNVEAYQPDIQDRMLDLYLHGLRHGHAS